MTKTFVKPIAPKRPKAKTVTEPLDPWPEPAPAPGDATRVQGVLHEILEITDVGSLEHVVTAAVHQAKRWRMRPERIREIVRQQLGD